MKLIWHIFLKDLRRLAVPLTLWVLLLAVKYLLGWRLISWTGTEAQYFQRMVQLGYVVVWFEVIANFLLVSRLVHEDPLVGGNAFWITRPISGGRLLAAKALGLVALFGALPLLVAMPWWLANHYDASLMGEAALELLLAQAAISLPALGLAVLTDGLSRLLLWLLVLAATATWWFFNALAGVSNLNGNSNIEAASLTRTCVALGLISLIIGIVVGLQYLTRRLGRSLIISAGGMVLVGLVAWLWPWNWAPSWRREYSGGPPIKVSSAPSGISFTMVRARVPDFAVRMPDYVKADLTMTLGARGLPADSMLFLGEVKHTWRWSDGTTLERVESGDRTYYDPYRDPALRRLLSLKELAVKDDWLRATNLDAGGDTVMRTRWARITPSFAARMHRESPAYTAELNYLLAQPELKFEFPLRAGAREWIGASSVRVAGKQLPSASTEPWRLKLVESDPVFVRLALSLSLLIPIQTERAQITCFAVNHQVGEAGYVSGWDGSRIVINSVMIAWKNLEVGGSWRGGTRADAERFMQDANLVGVGFRDYRYFHQTIQADRFQVTR